jgi:triosephosphate isomerase
MNPSRRPLIAGNWKMYKGGRTGVELAQDVVKSSHSLGSGVDLVIAPPFTVLAAIASTIEDSSVQLAAQNFYPKNEGAFTGEISPVMLKDCGCEWVIVGHSERRQYFGESNSFVAEKVAIALANDLLPIVCVGETLAQRQANETLRVVEEQLNAFVDIIARSPRAVAIAYEPVWAIGTGKVAGPGEAEEVHAAIRKWLAAKDEALATRTRLLYGGSVKPENAAALLACANVDGALVGGACLDAASFSAIAKAANR